jgi:rhodanese-related sulfurtransferase
MQEDNMLKKGFKQLLSEANQVVLSYSPTEAMILLSDESVVFVDVRDAPELQREGKIPGALHASRGMLEFLVDPESPFHNPLFASGKKFLFYCASGGRSALATKTAQEMGLEQVAYISGGIKAWKEASLPVESIN